MTSKGLSITREAVNALPIRQYDGPVMLASSEEELGAALAALRAERVVGFDTETRPAFRKGEAHLPALVQMAGEHAVYLFRPQEKRAGFVVAEILADPRIIKAGVALAHDLRQLRQLFAFEPHNVVELGAIAKRAGAEQHGLRNLAALFLGFRIGKGKQTSNWAKRRLTGSQIRYAATDAWACRELYLHFERAGWVRAWSAEESAPGAGACATRAPRPPS